MYASMLRRRCLCRVLFHCFLFRLFCLTGDSSVLESDERDEAEAIETVHSSARVAGGIRIGKVGRIMKT